MRRMKRFALSVAIAAAATSATWALAAPGVDVQINADAPGTVQNEVRITQNPANTSNLVVAYNDNVGSGSSPLGVSSSSDTGQTWNNTQLSIPLDPMFGTQLSVIFDPYIDADSQGNVYAGYIATDGSLGGPSGLYIERSQNGGASWSGPTTISFDTAATGPVDPFYRFNDRPDMTVDGSDNLYVVWIKDVGVGQPTSDIYFAKSPPPGPPSLGNPTGLDFTGGPGSVAPQTVNDMPNGVDRANAPDVAVASDGTVYVAWIDVDVTNPAPKPGTLLIDRSFDGGATFGADSTAQAISALGNHLSTGTGVADDARSGSYPAIAVDPANSQTVYMVYAADPAGPDEADIFFTKSTDGGLIWSVPMSVNDDLTTTDQFHPAIAVKPNGTIDVAWYDKRNSANDDAWDVYFTNSTDGGTTFSANVRITDQTFATPTNAPGTEPWLGEYLGLEVDATNAYIAFTSGITDSKGDVFFDLQPNVAAQQVVIDIKPGSDPNAINTLSGGVVPVAILTSGSFDATTVDPSTVCFGDAEDPSQRDCTEAHARGHPQDADGDGDVDLVLHFETGQTGIDPGDTQACLTGLTFGGAPVQGCDAITVVK